MMQLQVILLTLHAAFSLRLTPENIRRQIGQISFNNAFTMTSAQVFGYTFVNVPKVFIAISHLQISSNAPYSFNVEAQAITLTGFNFVMTASVNTAQFSFYFEYLASTDIHLENHKYCASSATANQLFTFNNQYSLPPQVALFLTGIQLSVVSNAITDYSITPTAISETSFQVFIQSTSANTVSKICFQAIIAPQNIIETYYQAFDFSSSPLTGSISVSTLVQNPFYFNNVYTILAGLTGAKYNQSPGLRSNTWNFAVTGGQITYIVETFSSGTLYKYSLDLMLYKPSTCGVNIINNQCLPVCGDGIVDEPEQCDDGNNQAFDGCFNCFHDCPHNCIICTDFQCNQCQSGYYADQVGLCVTYCGDGIVSGLEQCDSSALSCYECHLQCQPQCTDCRYGVCQHCLSGYYLNAFNQCEPFCGDLIIIGSESEQCDDGNLIPQDGCWNCQYDCPLNCQACAQGQCIQCNFGYYYHANQCASLCGDGIVAGIEYCDDGNDNQLDGCDQCRRACYLFCTNCINGLCLQCQTGYYLNNNQCTSLCGDLIIAGSEQCDDGNQDIYDGCDNCLIGCPYATFLYDNRCTNKCGDGLTADGFEQCDDGNKINNDGCSNCIIDKTYVCVSNFNAPSICYKCSQNCISCEAGICLSCISGFFFNQGNCIQCDQSCIACIDYPINCIQSSFPNSTCNANNGLYQNYLTKQCYSVCGDSVTAQTEQCDDGNILSGDGCNSLCQIEEGWQCHNFNPSYCKIKSKVNLLLESIQFLNNKYLIIVSLSQYCTINKAELIGINIWFSNTNLVHKYTALFASDVQNLQNISYLITITPFLNFDVLSLNVSTQDLGFITQDGIILPQMNLQVDLFDLQYVSNAQQNALNKIMLFNNYLIYIMIAVGISSLLVGSFEPVLNMLDLMQYISYLQWIDIYFPSILEEYLNIFNVVSLDLILQQLGITSSDSYQHDSTGYKLNYYEVNSYLIANLQSFFVTLTQTYTVYFFIVIFISKVINNPMTNNYCKLKLQVIANSLYKSSLEMHFSGFVQMIMASYYDLTICICLYVFYPNIDNNIDLIYGILVVGTILILLYTLQESSIINRRIMLQSLKSGIIRKTIYQMQYWQWSIVKKIVFCIIIVGFQESGIIQAILLSMNSISFACFLIINKPLRESSENFKILSVEIMVSFQSLSFIGYELINDLNILLYLQWINISILTLTLCLCLIIDLRKTSRRTYKQIKLMIKNTQCIDSGTLNKDFVV